MYKGERVTIALPSGELQKDVTNFLWNIGLDFTITDRKYFIPVRNMPIDFAVIRASSIPGFVNDERTMLSAGITGSDIVWESGMGKDSGEQLPIEQLSPESSRSSLYIGMTDEFYDIANIRLTGFKDPSIWTLNNNSCRVATKYPNITKEVFAERGMNNIEIIPVVGTDEAIQYIMLCEGILGIIATGKTIAANDIRVLETFYDVTTRMVEATDKLTRRDREILDGLRERIEEAVQKRKAATTGLM